MVVGTDIEDEGREVGAEIGVEDGGRICVWEEGSVAPFARGWIWPSAAVSLFVKDEMAHPAHEESVPGVLIPGAAAPPTAAPFIAVPGGGRAVSGSVCAYFRARARYWSRTLLAWSRTGFSLSSKTGHRAGRILEAQSSSLNTSEVAARASKAALRAWTKGSRIERLKAAMRTLDLDYDDNSLFWIGEGYGRSLTLLLRCFAILPRQIVVFVLMPGSASLAVLARYLRRSPLTTRSESFVMSVSIDFTVCSRRRGAWSVKPVIYVL